MLDELGKGCVTAVAVHGNGRCALDANAAPLVVTIAKLERSASGADPLCTHAAMHPAALSTEIVPVWRKKPTDSTRFQKNAISLLNRLIVPGSAFLAHTASATEHHTLETTVLAATSRVVREGRLAIL